jgi:hypothetical protein
MQGGLALKPWSCAASMRCMLVNDETFSSLHAVKNLTKLT